MTNIHEEMFSILRDVQMKTTERFCLTQNERYWETNRKNAGDDADKREPIRIAEGNKTSVITVTVEWWFLKKLNSNIS